MDRIKYVKRAIATCATLAMIFATPTTTFAAAEPSAVAPNESISSQQVSDDMALEILSEYLQESSINLNSITTEEQATSFLDDYIQFAVDNGYIADTPEQRAGLGVTVVRAVLSIAAFAGGIPFKTAGEYLSHSLQDNPSDLVYGPNTTYAEQIKESDEFDDIIDEMIQKAKSLPTGAVGLIYSSSTSLDSTTDLLLAYRAVSYDVHFTRTSSTSHNWTAEVVFHDTYDFDSDGWSAVWEEFQTGGFIEGGAEFLNMAADAAMDIGAIVEYDIEVTVETSFIA